MFLLGPLTAIAAGAGEDVAATGLGYNLVGNIARLEEPPIYEDLGRYRIGLRKPRSGGLGESNHMKAIFVRESREMEDGLVMLGGKWMKDTNDLTNAK
ncbi:hypothetical protein Tco_0371103 [Tanacetum coccineum]